MSWAGADNVAKIIAEAVATELGEPVRALEPDILTGNVTLEIGKYKPARIEIAAKRERPTTFSLNVDVNEAVDIRELPEEHPMRFTIARGVIRMIEHDIAAQAPPHPMTIEAVTLMAPAADVIGHLRAVDAYTGKRNRIVADIIRRRVPELGIAQSVRSARRKAMSPHHPKQYQREE